MQFRVKPLSSILAVTSLLSFAQSASADWKLNMEPGVTDIGQEIYGLHMWIFWICVVIGVIVFGIMFYSMLMHRKSRGVKAATFHESTKIEVLWTLIPTLILLAIGIPATKTLYNIYDTSNAELSVKITGYQWKWGYQYIDDNPDAPVKFFSNLTTDPEQINNRVEKSENYLLEVDNPLVLPIGKKIRFLVTANDVIHSWWVPAIAVKKDAIPGIINESWAIINEPGIYRGQCTELCGKDHGFMPVVIKAVEQDEYDAWYKDQQEQAIKIAELKNKIWSKDELVAHGKTVYATNCAACHGVNGEGVPGTFPALTDSPIATGDIAAHIDVVINGAPGTFMAAFGPQLSEVDIAAVVTYERNALGNDVGDMVTPLEIVDIKAGQ